MMRRPLSASHRKQTSRQTSRDVRLVPGGDITASPGKAAVATWTALRSEPELASDAKQTAKHHGNVWQWAHVRCLLVDRI